jgi:hypothetical protein
LSPFLKSLYLNKVWTDYSAAKHFMKQILNDRSFRLSITLTFIFFGTGILFLFTDRTCYFKCGNFSQRDFGGGTITERITEIERGKVLKMDVIDYNLVGWKWLGFKEAIYYFEKAGEKSCRLIRITTYTSELSPRFYWEPLEKIGIRQEHDYVFNNLDKDLKRKYRK